MTVVTTSDSPAPFVLLSASRHDAVVTTSDSPAPFVLLSALSRHDAGVTTSDSPSTLFCSSFGLSRHDAVVTTSDSPAPFVLLSASPVMMQWSPHRILQLHLFFFWLLSS